MFGNNEIVGKKFFRDAPKDSLFITSVWLSLQGEGPYAGLPAVFVRLTKCNLNCTFCDTFFDDGDWMTYQQINAKIYHSICDYWNNKGQPVPEWVLPKGTISGMLYPNIVLVITGGEPLLQENISTFMSSQLGRFKAVQVESNGIPDTDVPEGVTLVCSPKCAEKNGVATQYFKPSKTILERADCLKFVMEARTCSPYSSIPDWAFQWRDTTQKPIYISPMNVYNDLPQKIKVLKSTEGAVSFESRSTIQERINFFEPGLLNMELIEKNHAYVGEYCLKHGLRMNMQMHLFAAMA